MTLTERKVPSDPSLWIGLLLVLVVGAAMTHFGVRIAGSLQAPKWWGAILNLAVWSLVYLSFKRFDAANKPAWLIFPVHGVAWFLLLGVFYATDRAYRVFFA